MDTEFARRLAAGEAPFDGVTVYLDDLVPLGDARVALQPVIALLESLWQDARMCRLDDWYEHDGVELPAWETNWAEIHGTLASDDAMYAARTGDTYVKISFFPSDRRFYLRIDVIDESDETDREGRWVCFDFTADPMLVDRVVRVLPPLPVTMRQIAATAFFDRRGPQGHSYGP